MLRDERWSERVYSPIPNPALTRLSVNLNKVALVRNARAGGFPDARARPRLIEAAAAVLEAGAHGLTLHPRPDRRHALPEDVRDFAALLAGGAGVELNVEGNPFHTASDDYPGFIELCEEVRPDQATLVPDARGQLTSDHGWTEDDVEALRMPIGRLQAAGCRVSLFVDAIDGHVDAAANAGADRVELYTGPWAAGFASGTDIDILPAYLAAAERARTRGLEINAGHDLDLDNLTPLLRAIPDIAEASIGQALVARALEVGIRTATEEYLTVMGDG
jgi:pyridoxine 5-phosphate synthase